MSPAGAFDASKGAFYHIVFDGPPRPEMPRFIEVEDGNGRSCCVGEWRPREDGLWELLIPRAGWFGMDSAPKDREILICDGTVEYDGSLHGEMPFKGVVIACWNDCGWQGPNCGGHDEFSWHKPECWTHIPARSSANVPDAPAPVPPAGGGEDELELAFDLVWMRKQVLDAKIRLDVRLGRCSTWTVDSALALLDAYEALSHRPASQATRDEVIEECARVAENYGPARFVNHRDKLLLGRAEGECAASDNIARSIRALKQEPASDGWRTIDSAPRDEHVLLYDPNHGVIVGRFASPLCDWILQWGLDDWIGVEPTHWRPLPASPRALKQGGQE